MKALYFLAIVLLLLFVFWFMNMNTNKTNHNQSFVEISGKKISVEVMRTSSEHVRGLLEHDSLGKDEGMLFVYDNPLQPTFWMKGMKFAIDIIWILDDKVVGFVENALPDNGETLYPAPTEVNYVLEVYAGYVSDNNIQAGDTFVFLD